MFGFPSKKRAPEPQGPDFSDIDSDAKARELFTAGQLEKLFLMPPEFGGQDNRLNTVFVPLGIAAVKSGIDNNVIRPLVSEGKVTQYNAEPEYQGKSFIPIAIKITASNPGQFTAATNIWGEALKRK